MKRIFLLLLLLSLFSACHKENNKVSANREIESCPPSGPYDYLKNYNFGSVSTDSLVQKYQAIWKELFLEKNQLTNSFFDNHIKLIQSDTTKWNDGVSLSVCYEVQVGWAIAYSCDQFMIKIDSSVQQFGTFPRDKYLSKEQIDTIINNQGLSSYINKVAPINSLQFSSYDDALNDLIKADKVNTLCTTDVRLGDSGHLQLEAYGKYKNEENACISARLDLENGKTYITDGPCYIF
ncbi:MAG: hypothetical protein ABI267_01655 [Ginsengibacter sp.]